MRQLRSAYTSPDESVGLLLWQVTNGWQAAIRAALRPFELTHVQFVLLASLTWLTADEPVTQRDLAAHAATDPMMTSQVLRALEQRALVTRRPHPGDGRAWSVSVTTRGAALANRANAAVEACDAEFFAALGTDRDAFTAGLRALRQEKSKQA
ncbi:MAG TPA: MarR family transcriptional regulator [Jatrophihabitans sp.]|nr:MarR family transcriptional regulator [Jatrophihabitans sp.]